MAKKDVASIVSGGGLFLGIMTDFVSAVREQGGIDEDIHRLATPEGKQTILEMAKLAVRKSVDAFRVTVDYTKSLTAMIASGRYDWKNDDITDQHFSVEGSGTVGVDIELVHYNRFMSTDDVLKDLDRRGYRPAKLEELLALGAAKPELQREFPIVALGSVWQYPDGGRHCAYLYRDGSKRDLRLHWIEFVWRSDCRFAAVRK